MNSSTFTTSEIRAILSRQRHPLRDWLFRLDVRLTHLLARHSLTLLRVSAALVFLWIGLPKLIPGLHPAELATEVTALAVLQLAIAVSFLVRPLGRLLLPLLLAHLAVMLFAAPWDRLFVAFPFALARDGEIFALSLLVTAAGFVLAAVSRGGGLTSEANALAKARQIESKVE